MRKDKAIAKLGGSISAAAKKVGVSYKAIHEWPDKLPPRIADRVLAAVARDRLPPEELADLLADEQPAEAGQGA